MKLIRPGKAIALLAASWLLAACSSDTNDAPGGEAAAPELVVYSARKEHLIKPLFDRYTAETGVNIRYITDSAAPLLARLKSEGANTPADILITVDAGNLWHAAEEGVLAPIDSVLLQETVPAELRDAGNRWFGLTIRARTLVYSPDRVKPEELTSYEALADEKWRGRLCLRTSKKVYNQSLVAMMIAELGVEPTEELVKAWVANLAVAPFSNDTKAMEAVMAGQCDATIVNTYYFGRLQNQYAEQGKQLPLSLFWLNQTGRGVHVNISGAGVTAHSKHPEAAQALIEWLVQPEAQQMLVELNQEYPVNAAVSVTDQMQAWGGFKGDSRPVSEAGRLQAEAVKLMDRAGYN